MGSCSTVCCLLNITLSQRKQLGYNPTHYATSSPPPPPFLNQVHHARSFKLNTNKKKLHFNQRREKKKKQKDGRANSISLQSNCAIQKWRVFHVACRHTIASLHQASQRPRLRHPAFPPRLRLRRLLAAALRRSESGFHHRTAPFHQFLPRRQLIIHTTEWVRLLFTCPKKAEDT